MLIAQACAPANAPNVLDPRGPGAQRVEGLWWLMLWIATAVFVVVLAMLGIAIWRGRKKDLRPRDHVSWGEPFVALSGVVIPALILTVVFVISLREMSALSRPERQPQLEVEIVAHDWWWEVLYPESGVITANEIHIPVGEPVRLHLTTDDVIHSFWVPQLQVKEDMIPGKRNSMWLEADEPGRYRGQCAEFCGLQHAKMIFYVVADPPDVFERWLQDAGEQAATPATDSEREGRAVFLDSTCAGCHAILGTPADAAVGPDLTHLAGRETIASGALEKTRANLRRWILDPQSVKPGASMPPTDFTEDEIESLLDYLESLR